MSAAQSLSESALPAVHRRRMVSPPGEDIVIRIFEHLAAQRPQAPAALLHSSDHARTPYPHRSRRSILAFSFGDFFAEVRHRAGTTSELDTAGAREQEMPFFDWLRRNWTAGATPSLPAPSAPPTVNAETPHSPFALGWVGWLGYELKRECGSPDGTASANNSAAENQDAHLFRATHAVVIDHISGTAELQSWGSDPEWEQMVSSAFEGAATSDPDAASASGPGLGAQLHLRDSREEYLQKIRAAQAEIAEGNSYEICLTTALSGSLPGRPDGVALFRALSSANRSPFTQYLRFNGVEILSTSPERYLSIDSSGTVRSEPIKGTRPRGASHEEDEALRQDLLHHPKDRAENVMITDLVRNDLSIHTVPGTLRTERLCAVESYPSVHQLVSTVSARMAPGAHPADVVAGAFPPGSMTGAPKISTMNILERLETGPRGPYSGVAGYFSSTGEADLSVLIRSAVLTSQPDATTFHLGLGGAITADSDPEAEWDEVRTKSVGVLRALGMDFPDRAEPGGTR